LGGMVKVAKRSGSNILVAPLRLERSSHTL
jgi:hypothetical protein